MALSIQSFSRGNSRALEPLPLPSRLFPVPKMKFVLKENQFQSVEKIKNTKADNLNFFKIIYER